MMMYSIVIVVEWRIVHAMIIANVMVMIVLLMDVDVRNANESRLR